MAIRFNDSGSWLDGFKEVVHVAVDASRPAGEHWDVRICELYGTTAVTIDFARGTEARRWITVDLGGDDEKHSVLFRTVVRFLRKEWPGGIEPS